MWLECHPQCCVSSVPLRKDTAGSPWTARLWTAHGSKTYAYIGAVGQKLPFGCQLQLSRVTGHCAILIEPHEAAPLGTSNEELRAATS